MAQAGRICLRTRHSAPHGTAWPNDRAYSMLNIYCTYALAPKLYIMPFTSNTRIVVVNVCNELLIINLAILIDKVFVVHPLIHVILLEIICLQAFRDGH